MESNGQFIIRVYGIIRNEKQDVLVSDEFQLDQRMTKFPGGGLHFGEGPVDCLIREIQEECNGQEIEQIEHFYTTSFFQKALYYPNHQLISLYYQANIKSPVRFQFADRPFSFPEDINGSQSFRWIPANCLNPEEFTFPVDRLVAEQLRLNQKPVP
jgi:8-oxo-dGTP diphosphatase